MASLRQPIAVTVVLAAVAILALTACASAPAGRHVESRLATITGLPEYRAAHWGILAVDIGTGAVLVEHDADKLFAPASTTKLFTVAAALTRFGSEHRFATRVRARGEVGDDGVLHGDLVLEAGGDLTLGGRTLPDGSVAFADSDHTYANGSPTAALTEPDPLAGLRSLARAVASRGIRRADDVIVDDRLFAPAASSGSGPSLVVPILVNDNLVDFRITPATEGQLAHVEWRPRPSGLQVDAQVMTVGDGVPAITVEDVGRFRLRVRGTIAAGQGPVLRVHEVLEPAAFARLCWIEALREASIEVADDSTENRVASLPPVEQVQLWPALATLLSPAFAEHARLILKVSHNLHASTLPLLLAAADGLRTLNEGLTIQRRLLAGLGVDVRQLAFGGGAGGARVDSVTPRVTVQLLRAMVGRPEFAAFASALPVLGVDGTLANVVAKDSPARGRVRAKTGTYFLANPFGGDVLLTSKALAGYLDARSGRQVAFALFVNGVHLATADDTAKVGRDLGALCEVLWREL